MYKHLKCGAVQLKGVRGKKCSIQGKQQERGCIRPNGRGWWQMRIWPYTF